MSETVSFSAVTPSRKWILWVKWIITVLLIVSVLTLTIKFTHSAFFYWIGILFIAAAVLNYKLMKQRFHIKIDGTPLRVEIYLSLRGRIWITWGNDKTLGKACIGKYYGVPLWLDHKITLEEKKFDLRIYVQRYPEGFHIGNYGRGFDMVITQNKFCF